MTPRPVLASGTAPSRRRLCRDDRIGCGWMADPSRAGYPGTKHPGENCSGCRFGMTTSSFGSFADPHYRTRPFPRLRRAESEVYLPRIRGGRRGGKRALDCRRSG